MGKHEDALEVMLECLRIHRATDTENFQRVARLYANIGRQYAALGRYAEAEQIVLDGLAGLRREGLEKHQNTDYLRETLASIYFRQLRLDAARAEAESVLALHEMRVGEAHRSVVAAHTLLGQIALEEGDLTQARTHFERAARSFELDRVRMGTGISASTFLLRESPYELVSAVSAELGDWRMAWESIERTRGRALNEMIRSSQDLALSESDRKERDARRSDLLAALDSLTAARRAGEGIAEAENGLFVAQNRWEQLQSDLAMRPGAVGQPTVSLERVQRSLRAHEAILGWVEASQGARNRQRVWAYLIRNTGGVVWAPVDPPDASTPRAQADSFRDALEAPSRSAFGTGMDATLAEHEQALGAMWAGPLLEHMEGVEALIVVPSASISGIPIEALRDGDGTPLGDRFVVSYAPSATVLSWLAERPADRDARANALFVGDPPFRAVHAAAMVSAENAAPSSGRLDEIVLRDALYADPEALGKLPRLAWSRREVESASKSFAKSEVLVGPRACEPALRSLATEEQLHDFDVVHVATHALIDANDPLKSALVLSQLPADDEQGGADPLDGLLTGAEIAHGWKLDADLVTLSSCETATGRLAKGEGTIGFAYPFLAVGARCMLLSLWKVDDEATALLMQRFYENWRGADGSAREGGRGRDGAMTKAEALREAKHWLRSLEDSAGNRRFEHPYYWSAFVLIGDAG
jgi:CHAT domain-containing protein/tetratricopeptide (TPR) repeat protein